jgi:hypothetical protein
MEPQEIELLARAAHEMNRLYCIGIGDRTQVPWDEAPEWQQESAKKGVRGALNGNTPQQSHESWLAEKKETGWVYGTVKDAEKKTHPCMVDYADLPPEQRRKDDIFIATVRTLATSFGAAQLLKGDARMEKQLELKAAIEEVRRAVHCLSLEVAPRIQQEISKRVEALIALAVAVPTPGGNPATGEG